MGAVTMIMGGSRHTLATRSPGADLPRLLAILFIVVTLFALTVLQAPNASLRIFWRFAVLSFDNPSTQALDELASESSTSSGIATGAREFVRLVPTARLMPAVEASRPGGAALSSGITRSPPAA
jgi:hypothetical protein